jgi:hypothetical protein
MPPVRPKRPVATAMALLGFVAGVVTVILVVRYFF